MAEIGFALSEQFPAPELLEYGVAAERAGFNRIWAADHFHPWMDNQGHSTQSWLMLAALGQRTERLTIGTGVTCPTYRYSPQIVAQSFATLGLMYPGRVFLGLGTGEALNEQAVTGEWGEYQERHDRLVEAIALIRKLWTGEWVTHQGQFYQVQQAKMYDLPTQPVPIYIAASGEQSMRMAGQYGDGLVTDEKSLLMPEMRAAFEDGAREAGKDPQRMPILVEHFCVVGGQAEATEAAKYWRFIPKAWDEFVTYPDPREIQRTAEQTISDDEVTKNWVVSEDGQEHAQGIQKLIDAGATQVFIHSGQLDQHRVIEFFGREVLPQLVGARSRAA
ncbi:MAG: TIGR03557 family F420-dependent LLM class oxidoreductase [Roseiflexaceae bacterium]|nr:TIGR03557 family F420-dependent LLM class oxidoreductase [Roseiflexaceae bacterium]